jgi:thiol-disulfide isomerase/thioredoxin
MRKILILIGMLYLLIGCNISISSQGLLTASLENIPNGTVLNVFDLDSWTLYKRITVFDNKFEFAFNFPTPRKIGIWEDNPKYDKYRLILWLENSKINITGNYDYFVNAKVVGSASNIIYEQFESLIRKFDNRLSNLEMSGRLTNNQVVKDSISREVAQVQTQYKDEKIQLYLKLIDSDVAFFNLVREITNLNSVLSKNDIDKVYNELPNKFKLSKKGELLKEYISLPEIPKVGEKFIDCSQFTTDGKTESMSSHLGKYTILEFWASGCEPCSTEHPILRKIYNLYHEKGLNIISISGDVDSNDWKNAIKNDSLTWTNISDLRGFTNVAFMIYRIKGIPQIILLDEKGIIIDDELGQKDLEHEIEIRLK